MMAGTGNLNGREPARGAPWLVSISTRPKACAACWPARAPHRHLPVRHADRRQGRDAGQPGRSLASAGNEVLIVDACQRDYGVARRLEMERHVSLLQVARQECALNQVVQSQRPRVSTWRCWRATASPGNGSDEARRLSKAFDVLVKSRAASSSSMAN
jgi:hypothetical protein